jgi:hypothetical protein
MMMETIEGKSLSISLYERERLGGSLTKGRGFFPLRKRGIKGDFVELLTNFGFWNLFGI